VAAHQESPVAMNTELDAETLANTLKNDSRLLSFFCDDVIALVKKLPEDADEQLNSPLLNGYWELHQHNKSNNN
jgi:hypothetical protein